MRLAIQKLHHFASGAC